ncbi:MAG: hypothetical protein KDB02_05725 [Acidimicrobiales bacterium]|nr:hypothetical protein [Acidimicrobiales bacterium]MCB1246120.1 hypothetical protein [Acidimicrobiia bacterium]
MGSEVETLADLIPNDLRVLCVGINPAPRSVAAGHYYQGQTGQAFFRRLASAGIIDLPATGYEDDAAFAQGIGFTDIVKRPTASADQVTKAELAHGRDKLLGKRAELGSPVVIFTFKAGATAMLGPFQGNGWRAERLSGSRVFVMPGPYEQRQSRDRTLRSLAEQL